MSDVGTVLSTIISGMLLGGMLALTALGLSIVLGVMRLVNLAHGDFLVVGAYAGLFFLKFTGVDPLLGLPVIALFVAALAVPLYGLLRRGADDDDVCSFDHS
jgi:branched-chain amino acid transport system permease protein